jgi:hypothetical protein
VNALKLLFLRSLSLSLLDFCSWKYISSSLDFPGLLRFRLYAFRGELVLCSSVLEMSSFSDKFCFLILKRKKKMWLQKGAGQH